MLDSIVGPEFNDLFIVSFQTPRTMAASQIQFKVVSEYLDATAAEEREASIKYSYQLVSSVPIPPGACELLKGLAL